MGSSATSAKTLPITTNGTVLIHINFLLTGIVMTFLGPMLPILASRWQINDAQSGRLFLTQFVSSMFGMMASAPLVQRVGYRATFMLGLILMACGMGLLWSGSYLTGVAAVAILGLGHGITTPAGNLRTVEVNPVRSASALNVINAIWGFGAMSPSFLLDLGRRFYHPEWLLYFTSSALLVLLLAFALTRFEQDSRTEESTTSSGSGVFSVSLLTLIAALFFIYVGTETAFGQWVATYAHRLSPRDHNLWALMPSFFYGAMLVGRSSAPIALKFARERSVARAGLVLAAIGGLALLRAQGTALILVGALLAGLGLASIFPISVSLLPYWFRNSVGRASGIVFAMGNLGGAVLPWLVGVVSFHSGSLRLAFLVPLTGALLMLGFYVLDGRSPVAGKAA